MILALAFAFALSARAGSTCNELGVGQIQRVNLSPAETGTSLSAKYLLRRTGEKNYELSFNLILETKPEAALIRARVKRCFADMGDGLNDAEGKTFNFNLLESNSENQDLAIVIHTVKAGERGDMLHFAPDMPCVTYIHETLHNTGLVDEYRERDLKISRFPAFNCRVVGRKSSIMNNMYDFLTLFSPAEGYDDFGPPLLTVHSRMIIHPGCLPANWRYASCAQHAYETEMRGWILGGHDCEAKSALCSTDQWLEE